MKSSRATLVCAYVMQENFQNKYYDELVQRIKHRLHLPDSTLFTGQHVLGLWTLCISALPHSKDTEDACSLFSRHELKMMEWVDDTKLLNKKGWPWSCSMQMASPLLQDISDALSPGRLQHPERKARILLFGHTATLCPLLCRLGLFGAPFSSLEQLGGRIDSSITRRRGPLSCDNGLPQASMLPQTSSTT